MVLCRLRGAGDGEGPRERRVAALLDELEQRRQRLYVLQARGARPAGLRDLKAELRAIRNELAAVVAAAGSPALG